MSSNPSTLPTSSCYTLQVQKGRRYLLCTCGLSSKKPLCNGAHAGTGRLPDFHTAETTGTLDVCYCARSSKAPLCDRSCSASSNT
jgi:CDGSH-type Zn-finger protein